MEFPLQVKIGGSIIPLHVIFELLAFFIGFRYFIWLRKRKGDSINSPNRVTILIGAIFGALLGSRLVGALENPVQLANADNLLLYIYENKTILGGLLGGLLGVELVKKLIGEKQASGDLFVYPILLALIIGRIGCFTMGIYEETYGLPTSLPWAMDLGDGIPRHPVTLYEITFLILFWLMLVRINCRTVLQQGALFKLFMIGYISFRFLQDFIKPHYTFPVGLSTIQLACIIGLLWYMPYIIHPKKLIVVHA